MKTKYLLFGLISLLTFTGVEAAFGTTIDFETLSDSEVVTNQYAGLGVTFSNAIAYTAGISLNEVDFPPHSGLNVVSDNGGPMGVTFSAPQANVSAYFTYTVPLTLSFYDALNNLEGTVNSAFSSNFVSSGNPPNEFLSFAWVSGISEVVITGDPSGSSFVMDDLTFTPVPEPATLFLLLSGLLGIAGYRIVGRRG